MTDLQIAKEVKRYRNGDTSALLRAVALGVKFCRPIPADMAAAFDAGVTRWDSLEVKTLGEAFGIEDRNGKGLRARMRHRKLEMVAWAWVRELVSGPSDIHPDGGMSVTEASEQVADELHISVATAKRLYEEAEAVMSVDKLDETLEVGGIALQIRREHDPNTEAADELIDLACEIQEERQRLHNLGPEAALRARHQLEPDKTRPGRQTQSPGKPRGS